MVADSEGIAGRLADRLVPSDRQRASLHERPNDDRFP